MEHPFFSIITPTHNNQDTILETIASVQNQTFDCWEYIIVDDYSEDSTLHIINEFPSLDDRIATYSNSKILRGGNVCRNIGLNYSKGRYLIFLDGDDLLTANCLRQRFDKIQEYECGVDMLISKTVHYDRILQQQVGLFGNISKLTHEMMIADFIKQKILWTTTSPSWNADFLKNIGGWNENYPRLQDVELNIRALLYQPKIGMSSITDSFLMRSDFNAKKQRNAFVGFTLLLRDYYYRLMKSSKDEAILELYSDSFGTLVGTILNYWKLLDIKANDIEGEFFISTLKDIMDEEDFQFIFRSLLSNSE